MSVAQLLRQSESTHQQPGRHIHLIDRTPSSVPLPPPRTLPSGLVVGIDRQEGIKRLLAGGRVLDAYELARLLGSDFKTISDDIIVMRRKGEIRRSTELSQRVVTFELVPVPDAKASKS